MAIKNQIQFRRGSSAEWIQVSNGDGPVLSSGEPGFDITNNVLKIGDGSTNWKDLKPINNIDTSGSTDNQYLRYNESSDKWIPTSSGTFSSGLHTNGLNILTDITILGENNIPAWNHYTTYSKSDVVNFESQYYTALIDFSTECPGGAGPAGWYCCSDLQTIAPTPEDCDNGFTSFSPTAYPVGWSSLASGELTAKKVYSYNIYNHNDITSSNIITNDILIREGNVIVNKGIIEVNNSFDNNFNMTINSSGINILTDYEFIVDHTDRLDPVPPPVLLTNTSLNPNQVKLFLNNQTLEIGNTVLFKAFADIKTNGIYAIDNGVLPNTIKFVRHPNYINNTILQNGTIFGVQYDGGSYILNASSTVGQNVTIGTDNLSFTKYQGLPAVTFSSNKDAEFSAAVYAKEKYFRIKHPDPDSSYQHLQYGSLESPYHGVRLTGESELKKGVVKIPLPKYLKHLIHKTDINIQLTNKGHHKILYVDSVNLDKDHFVIKGYRSKTGGPFAFYWSFTGVRKDVDPLIPEN